MNINQTLWIILVFLIIVPLFAQNDPWHKEIIFDGEKISLRNVLRELSRQTEARFVYVDTLVDSKRVTVQFNGVSFEKAFKHLINQTDLGYTVLPNYTIVLHQKKSQNHAPLNRSPFILPRLKNQLDPAYPELARYRGIEGKVEMRILISENGQVQLAKINCSSGDAILDQAALDYAEKLEFFPAMVGKQTTRIWMKWTVNYVLQDQELDKSGQIIREAKSSDYRENPHTD